MREKITIQQEIEIEYEEASSREAAIARLLEDTNWIVVFYGYIENLPIKYKLIKTNNISIVSE